jgi:NAD(P)-dependent dehydrogenase (short-subunit alcohol dehydrogenase family)
MSEPGRRAVIVGSSDGIGRGLADRLLAEGWTVTGVSRSPGTVAHERYRHHLVDVTGPGYPSALRLALDGAGVDLCVYSAGIGELLDLTDLSGQTRTLDVNVMGAAHTLEAVLPRMIAARRGHFIGLSSLADVMINPQSPSYSASKAALTSYLAGMALAARPHGVVVSTVRFGFVTTKMMKARNAPGRIPVAEAVDVLMRTIRTRAAVVSYPRRIALGANVLRLVGAARLRRLR